MSNLTYITDNQVKDLLTWPDVFEAVDIAFRSVSKDVPRDLNVPRALQPAKIFTRGDYMSGKEYPSSLSTVLITTSYSPLRCSYIHALFRG